MYESEKWKWSGSVVSDSLWPRGLQPTVSSVHRIFQARVLDLAAIAFSVTLTHTHSNPITHIQKLRCTHTHTHTYIHTLTCTHIHTLTHINTHTNMHTHMYPHTHMHTYTHSHIHSQTYTSVLLMASPSCVSQQAPMLNITSPCPASYCFQWKEKTLSLRLLDTSPHAPGQQPCTGVLGIPCLGSQGSPSSVSSLVLNGSVPSSEYSSRDSMFF